MPFSAIITLYSGFTHALETDHLLAVSNIVTRRKTILSSIKDGMFWGFGHTTTILCIGIITILFRMNIRAHYFNYFEAIVGLMLVLLGTYRLIQFFSKTKTPTELAHMHAHMNHEVHTHIPPVNKKSRYPHIAAYGIGLVHGLAGSGALILIGVYSIFYYLDWVLF
jgi:high-affinity nickel permease